MEVAISAAERDAEPTATAGARPVHRFARVVVIGGGCYGSWYLQQLARAMQKGALTAREIVVVDRDPDCRVAGALSRGEYAHVPARLAVSTWDDYLAHWLAQGSEALRHDAMVPSPLMPHVCLDWLIARARSRHPERQVTVEPLPMAPATPWERAAPDGRHYVSFATWTCPVNCIEPATCPATRGPRDWSMPVAIRRQVASEPSLRGSAIFHCAHRTYGVGMIDAADIARADEQIAAWSRHEGCRVLVGTVSHCHGALGVLAIH